MPIDWNAQPQWWAQVLPNKDDYASAEDYLKALQQGSEDTSAPIGQYYDPIADRTRGGAHTEREQAVRYFNQDWRFNQPNAGLAMQSWIGLHPEAATQAYQAYDAMGNPQVDPALLAMIEQILGEDALVPAPPAGEPTPGEPAKPDLPMQPTPIGGGGGKPDLPMQPHPVQGAGGGSRADGPQGMPPGMVNEGSQMNDLMYRIQPGSPYAQMIQDMFSGQQIGGMPQAQAQPFDWQALAAQLGDGGGAAGGGMVKQPGAGFGNAPAMQQTTPPGANWLQQLQGQNQSTVDPNYPDFILQRLRQGQKGTPGGGMAPPRMPMGY